MANLSDMTRKEQVFAILLEHLGLWVDGTMLANEQVGGSEGLKRLRELRADLAREASPYRIQQRKHPDPGRSIYQYRLVKQASLGDAVPAWAPKETPFARSVSNPAPARSDRPAGGVAPAPQSLFGGAPPRHPGEDGPRRDTQNHDWHAAKKSPGTLEYIFWIGKQRVIGSVGQFGSDRWGWGVLVPANKSRNTPEKRHGHGVQPTKEEAMAAVEECVREMRKTGEYR